MRFEVRANQVHCLREIPLGPDGEYEFQTIVTFDEHLDEPAPHVTAVLTPHECRELGKWMAERLRIQSLPRRQAALVCAHDLAHEIRVATRDEAIAGEQEAKRVHGLACRLAKALHGALREWYPDLAEVGRGMPHADRLRTELRTLAGKI